MVQTRFLYSSTSKRGLKYLLPALLTRTEGFKKGERGVWATDDLVLSRAFGIDRKEFGTFYLDPRGRQLALVNWKFKRIPKNLVAYTYYVQRGGFKRVRARDWKFVCRDRAKVLKVEPYRLRDYLLEHFELFELTQKRVRKI